MQESAAKKGSELCQSWLQDKCHWGDKCRYSHDVEAFVKAKPADLPGRCPFSATGECTFGGWVISSHLKLLSQRQMEKGNIMGWNNV